MSPCKIILGIKILLFFSLLATGQSTVEGTVPGPFSTHGRAKETVIGKRIQRVVDGDTVIVDGSRIRLLNVDTEESVHPNQSRNTSFGRETSRAVKKAIQGKTADLECYGKDRYSRRLCYLFVDGENFNVKLVKQGWSRYYTKFGFSKEYHDQFIKAEEMGQSHGTGVWDKKE